MQYKVALFIGRFQPFHNGHLFALQESAKLAEQVVVMIANSEEQGTDKNPFSYELRREMINKVLDSTTNRYKISQILPLPDTPSDAVWVASVEQRILNNEYRKQDVIVVSNNEWVTSLLAEAGFPVYETGLYNRVELEGVKIRALMRQGDVRWRKRVPASLSVIYAELEEVIRGGAILG